jgi:hypothetical protein
VPRLMEVGHFAENYWETDSKGRRCSMSFPLL